MKLHFKITKDYTLKEKDLKDIYENWVAWKEYNDECSPIASFEEFINHITEYISEEGIEEILDWKEKNILGKRTDIETFIID